MVWALNNNGRRSTTKENMASKNQQEESERHTEENMGRLGGMVAEIMTARGLPWKDSTEMTKGKNT